MDNLAGGRDGLGEVETVKLATISRPVLAATADDVGLSLAETKPLLTKLQEAMVRGQVAEYLCCRRVCPNCLTSQPAKRTATAGCGTSNRSPAEPIP